MKAPKTNLFFLLLGCIFITVACRKDTIQNEDPILTLPELTHEGKHTFGCKINGEVWVAKVNGGFNGPRKLYAEYFEDLGGLFIAATFENQKGTRWEDVDLFTLKGIYSEGIYRFSTNTGYDGDGSRILYFYDNKDNWPCKAYYHDSLNTSILNITYFDTINHIISGTFELDATNRDCEDSIMHVTDGRFDVRYN